MAAGCLRVADVFLLLFEHVFRGHLAAYPLALNENVNNAVGVDQFADSGPAAGKFLVL